MIGEKGENATAPAETPGPSRFRDHIRGWRGRAAYSRRHAGSEHRLVALGVELLAEIGDVDVDDVAVAALDGFVPDMPRDRVAPQRLIRVAHEALEQLELALREGERPRAAFGRAVIGLLGGRPGDMEGVRAVGRIRARVLASMRCRVVASSGAWMLTMSPVASSS